MKVSSRGGITCVRPEPCPAGIEPQTVNTTVASSNLYLPHPKIPVNKETLRIGHSVVTTDTRPTNRHPQESENIGFITEYFLH